MAIVTEENKNRIKKSSKPDLLICKLKPDLILSSTAAAHTLTSISVQKKGPKRTSDRVQLK